MAYANSKNEASQKLLEAAEVLEKLAKSSKKALEWLRGQADATYSLENRNMLEQGILVYEERLAEALEHAERCRVEAAKLDGSLH